MHSKYISAASRKIFKRWAIASGSPLPEQNMIMFMTANLVNQSPVLKRFGDLFSISTGAHSRFIALQKSQ
jgi:hypothetical protein